MPETENRKECQPFGLRRARACERALLDALCHRAKAVWGYDDAFMRAVGEHIRVSAAAIREGRTFVATDGGDRPLGVVEIGPPDAGGDADLALLFVAPEALRQGIGRALYRKALEAARSLGARELVIDSDPHAAGFYAAMGASRIGAEPTGYQGRLLPRFRSWIAPTPPGGLPPRGRGPDP